MRIGLAADHGGFPLKEELVVRLKSAGREVVDFGAHRLTPDDDYPDFVISLGRAVAADTVDRGLAVCGSGVGASNLEDDPLSATFLVPKLNLETCLLRKHSLSPTARSVG